MRANARNGHPDPGTAIRCPQSAPARRWRIVHNPTDVITLQWASVGELRENEAYAVTIEDVTEGNARKLVEYVKDTKFIVPESFRPTSTTPHVFRWSILPVRQTGTRSGHRQPSLGTGRLLSARSACSAGSAPAARRPANTYKHPTP